jgi:hypothetical protein
MGDFLRDLKVTPYPGFRTNMVTWICSDSMPSGVQVQIFRHERDGAPKIAVSEKIPAINQVFVDTRMENQKGFLWQNAYYTLLVFAPGQPPKFTNSVSFFGDSTAAEKNLAAHLINEQQMAAAAGHAQRAFLFKRLVQGPACNCEDVLSGRNSAAATCVTCVGTGKLKGWADPVTVWVQKINPQQRKYEKMQGMPKFTSDMIMLIASGFPVLAPDDVLMFPGSTEKYVIEDPVQTKSLRGIIPLEQEFVASKLARSDVRQHLGYKDGSN